MKPGIELMMEIFFRLLGFRGCFRAGSPPLKKVDLQDQSTQYPSKQSQSGRPSFPYGAVAEKRCDLLDLSGFELTAGRMKEAFPVVSGWRLETRSMASQTSGPSISGCRSTVLQSMDSFQPTGRLFAVTGRDPFCVLAT